MKMKEIAETVRRVVSREMGGREIPVVTTPTDDNRSYHVSSEKIRRELGFVAHRSVEDAVVDLARAFRAGKIPDAMEGKRYYNIKTMQAIKLH